MARRSYEQYCAVAKALDVVGERWTLLVLRDLVHLGPRRYKDLLDGLPGIGTNLLADRLRRLEANGLVRRRLLPPPAGSVVYELTELGRGLEPAIVELGRFGGAFMAERASCDVFLPTGHVSAIRATFRPEPARGVVLACELRVDGQALSIRIDDGTVDAAPGPSPDADVVIETDVDTSIELMLRRMSPSEALTRGVVRVEGALDDFERAIDLLAWIPPAPASA
jgi:DNA-binding HxlR family transcriptional regulator